MGMGFAPTWLRQVSPPLLHKTTLTTVNQSSKRIRVGYVNAWAWLGVAAGGSGRG